jgi:hypothetical protein
MADRLAAVGDLWLDLPDQRRGIEGANAEIEKQLTDDDWKQAMAATTRRPTSRNRAPKL